MSQGLMSYLNCKYRRLRAPATTFHKPRISALALQVRRPRACSIRREKGAAPYFTIRIFVGAARAVGKPSAP